MYDTQQRQWEQEQEEQQQQQQQQQQQKEQQHQRQERERLVRLHKQLQDTPPHVEDPEGKLRQLLLQSISNQIQAC